MKAVTHAVHNSAFFFALAVLPFNKSTLIYILVNKYLERLVACLLVWRLKINAINAATPSYPAKYPK